jgi:hypothetical protein
MLCLMFAIIVKAVFIHFIFYQKYSCQAKYPAGYPVSGPYQISGIRLLDKPDIRPVGYPAKTVSDASLPWYEDPYPVTSM